MEDFRGLNVLKKSLSEHVLLLRFAGPFQKLLENGIMDATRSGGDAYFEEMPIYFFT